VAGIQIGFGQPFCHCRYPRICAEAAMVSLSSLAGSYSPNGDEVIRELFREEVIFYISSCLLLAVFP
jgi:hypothetical protein